MQQLSLTVKCVTWIGCSNAGGSVTNESNASRFQRVDRGDPTVTQIHFKRLALGKLMDRRWLRRERAHAMSLYWQSVKCHVDVVGQITSFCPCTYLCVWWRGRVTLRERRRERKKKKRACYSEMKHEVDSLINILAGIHLWWLVGILLTPPLHSLPSFL